MASLTTKLLTLSLISLLLLAAKAAQETVQNENASEEKTETQAETKTEENHCKEGLPHYSVGDVNITSEKQFQE
jgi:cytochrome c-type biogenesis protein CcmH/NrfF